MTIKIVSAEVVDAEFFRKNLYKKEHLKEIIDKIDKITSFTCECNSVSFIKDKCKSCGKKYKYGELDYDEVLKIIKEEMGELE